MSLHVPVVVIGGGISGLVCGHALRKAGTEVLLLEASPQPGGVIHSEHRDGYLLELGPQSFNATAPILALCRELQIESQLVKTPEGAPRYVFIDGHLQAVPLSPPAFFKSPLFSVRTKWRVLKDIVGRTSAPRADESLADFVRRKFSAELLEKLVGPFVSGIYAGNPERLSLQSAFPQLHEAERSAGSVVRGLLRAGKKGAAKEKPSLQTFRDGNQTLVDALGRNLGTSIRYGTTVKSVSAPAPSNTSGFELTLQSNDRGEQIVADRLVVATNAPQAAQLLRGLDPRFDTLLQGIEYAPVVVISLGYRKTCVKHSLHGFGFLAPRSSRLRVLGSVWNSSLFPGRAPDGHVLLTSFLGGVTDPNAISMSKTDLIATVHRELAPILGISNQPGFSHVEKYPLAIPQLNIGHAARVSELRQLTANYPNLHLAGNYLRGPALGLCVEQALTIAAETVKT